MRHARKIRKGRVFILIVAIIAIIATIVGGIFLLNRNNSPYQKYDESNKGVGTVSHFESKKEKDVESFKEVSIFYPTYENEVLDKIVKDFYETEISAQEINETDTLYMDYSDEKVVDQYISTKLVFSRYDEKDEQTYTSTKVFTYDTIGDRVLEVKDLFRNRYHLLLNELGLKDLPIDNTDILVGKKELSLYKDGEPIKVNYDDNMKYLALNNNKLNPNYPADGKIIPEQDIDPNKPMIAITFDDGPHRKHTPRLLDILDKYDAKCTFFVLGSLVDNYQDIVKETYKRGHEIANHTKNHLSLPKLSKEELEKEVYDPQDSIFKITGKAATSVRPPYGAYNDVVQQMLDDGGVYNVLWTIDTEDWKNRDPEIIKNEIVKHVSDGSVILLHDIHKTSVEAMETVLPALKEKGYQIVTVETLRKYRTVNNGWY